MINKNKLIKNILKVYEQNKPLLDELPYKQSALIMGFLGTILRVFQNANEKELEDYDQFVHYFYEFLHDPNNIEIPSDFSEKANEIAKKKFGVKNVQIDAETLKSAFKKISLDPQVMAIFAEVVQAFDQAREN